jgi:FtsH-binding integral membrane protein
MLASFAAHFDTESVVIAVGICAAVTLVLTLFAFQTKIDFTACGGILLCLLMILMVSGIIMIVVRDK